MRRILITGATGLLGSNLCARAANDFEICGVARTSTVFPPNCVQFHFDLTDEYKSLRCLEETRPDIIVHCAAITDVDRCEAEPGPARDIHVKASRILAEWADNNGCFFVYISTDSVFDGRAGNYNELDLPAPLNEYGRTKLAGEMAVLEASPSALILRTNFYGLGGTRNNLITWILNQLESGQEVRAFADVYFNPLPAGTVAEIILELIERDARGTLHVGAMDFCSKYEFAQQFAEVFDFYISSVIPISVNEFPFKARRPKGTTLDVRKVAEFLGRDMPMVHDGLNDFKKRLENEGVALSIMKSTDFPDPA